MHVRGRSYDLNRGPHRLSHFLHVPLLSPCFRMPLRLNGKAEFRSKIMTMIEGDSADAPGPLIGSEESCQLLMKGSQHGLHGLLGRWRVGRPHLCTTLLGRESSAATVLLGTARLGRFRARSDSRQSQFPGDLQRWTCPGPVRSLAPVRQISTHQGGGALAMPANASHLGTWGTGARTIPCCAPWFGRVRSGSRCAWGAMFPVLVALWMGMEPALAMGAVPTGLPGYRVRGVALAHDIAAERESPYDFEVLVVSNRWRIDAIAHHIINAPRLKITAASDGECLYHLMHHHPEFTSVEVTPLPIPNWDHWLGTIWLTYCSAAYLASQKTNWLPLPVIMYALAGQPTIDVIAGLAVRQETYWRPHREPPGLPEWFVSLCPGEILVASTYGAEWIGERYLPPYEEGFTNILFRADSFRDISGWHLPREAVLEVWSTELQIEEFRKNRRKTLRDLLGGPIRRRLIVTIRASSMEAVNADIQFPPALSGGSSVKDWRWENDQVLAMVRHWFTNRLPSRAELLASERKREGYDYVRFTNVIRPFTPLPSRSRQNVEPASEAPRWPWIAAVVLAGLVVWVWKTRGSTLYERLSGSKQS